MAVKRTLRIFGGIAALITLLVVVIAAAWPAIAPRLIYSPRTLPENHRSPDVWRYSGEQVHLQTRDGETLHGWWLTSTADVKNPCTVLFTHGNAGNVTSQAGFMRPFLAAGFDALVFDYRGYGASSGDPSESGLYIDAATAFEYLATTRGVRSEHILIVGHSLGSAVATELASRQVPAGLILAAPFSSFPEAMTAHAPWIPVGLFRWKDERFDAGSRIGSVSVPILVVAGADDRLVPESVSRPLYDAAPVPKSWVNVPGGHNTVFRSDEFARALVQFTSGRSACAVSSDTSAV